MSDILSKLRLKKSYCLAVIKWRW